MKNNCKSENLLNRIVEIQKIVLENQVKGVTNIWVYKNLIYPRFFISLGTFNRYLVRNAKKELKELTFLKSTEIKPTEIKPTELNEIEKKETARLKKEKLDNWLKSINPPNE